MKCIECGAQTEERVIDRELQVALPYRVVLRDAPAAICPDCGEEYVGIRDPISTFMGLAQWIARRPGRLHGSEVRFIRNALAWTQEQLGRKLGVAPETVSRWENGKKPVGYQSELALRFLVLVGSQVADQLDSTQDVPARVEIGPGDDVRAAS